MEINGVTKLFGDLTAREKKASGRYPMCGSLPEEILREILEQDEPTGFFDGLLPGEKALVDEITKNIEASFLSYPPRKERL